MVSALWWKLTIYCLQPKGRVSIIACLFVSVAVANYLKFIGLDNVELLSSSCKPEVQSEA